MPYDFASLKGNQRALLACNGWVKGSGRSAPREETVGPLVAMGLIVVRTASAGAFQWDEFDVPPDVRAAWVLHLADDIKRRPW